VLGILESEEKMVKRKQLDLKGTNKLRDAVDAYLHSPSFAELTGPTQKQYETRLAVVCDTTVQKGKMLGNIKLRDISVKHVTYAYDTWVNQRGPRAANYNASCLSIVLNLARRHEALLYNPVSLLKRKTDKPRSVKWTTDDVRLFLDTAYSHWWSRSIGLIVHMSYEWGQRIGDMRLLKWDAIDFDQERVDITQSKRGAEVHLPIDDGLLVMLKKQKEDFGFQPYVAPHVKPKSGSYNPYSETDIHHYVNRVKDEAGLDPDLQARDLRRTAITEMVEAGVDLVGIMQVSGHQNPASVKPYLVNTLSGASAALAKRKGITE
jgi:integrase